MDNQPLYTEITDSATGQTYLVDPLTGQLVTLTDATTGEQRVASGYNPAARDLGGRSPVSTENTPAPVQVVSPPRREAIDALTGQPRPDLTPLLPTAPLAEQPAAAAGSSPGRGYGSGGYGGYAGYSRGGYGGGGYDGYGTTPRYGNGSTHPYFGGPPLTPGGAFAQASDGYDDRVQVTASSGATAGPYGVRAAPAPDGGNYGSGGGGGGGGGIARDLYWNFANKIKAKLTGEGRQPAGYEDFRQQRMRPYRGPEDPRTVRKTDRYDARFESRASTYGHPEFAIPRGVNLESPLGDRMQGLPGFDLALMAGAGKKNWKGGIDPRSAIYTDYYKALNKRLEKGKPGMDFAPFYKKALRKDRSLDQYNRVLQNVYDRAAAGTAIDTASLFGNLTQPKKGTYLREQFKNAPAGSAADQYLQSVGALIGAGEFNDIQQAALSGMAQDAVNRYGQRFAGRNPRRTPSLNRWVGRQLGGYLG